MEEELCYNCGLPEIWAESTGAPGAVPKEGDAGICAEWCAWWRLKDGKREPYTPSIEDQRRIDNYLRARRAKKKRLTRAARLN